MVVVGDCWLCGLKIPKSYILGNDINDISFGFASMLSVHFTDVILHY